MRVAKLLLSFGAEQRTNVDSVVPIVHDVNQICTVGPDAGRRDGVEGVIGLEQHLKGLTETRHIAGGETNDAETRRQALSDGSLSRRRAWSTSGRGAVAEAQRGTWFGTRAR